ncbi:MAG: FAD-dependent oxidoreductase [Luteolibacter sp.]
MTEDITIIGGGLTGLSLAVGLRANGIPVTLHEAGQYPRHRVCGEFISGVSKETLDHLAISSALADAAQHSTVSWFRGNSLLRKNCLPSPALSISRHLLDDRLRQLATAEGATILTSSRQKITPDNPGTVWAAGRKPVNGTWIGLKAHIRGIETTSHLEMHSGSIGYLGIAPVENGWNNVCGLFRIDRSITQRHADLLPAYLRKNGNTRLADLIASAEWKEDSFTAVAGFGLGLQEPTPGVLTLGDSHAIIPPFTGNGMTMAFQSAEIALPTLTRYAEGEFNWQTACSTIATAHRKTFRKRLTAAKFLHPLLFKNASLPLLKHAPISPILNLIR